MMNDGKDWLNALWIVLASLAGALSSLSFRPWESLSKIRRLQVVFFGCAFAIFVGPLLVRYVAPDLSASDHVLAAFYYMFAAGANWLFPWLMEKFTGVKPDISSGPADGKDDQP